MDAMMVVCGMTPTHRHLRSRLATLLMATVALDAAASVVIYLSERRAPGSDIHSVGDAVFWTTTQLTTVSSQLRNPVSTPADPVAVHWAVRDAAGVVIDFESCYANRAMARVFGISMEQTLGHRLVEESPAYRDEPAFKRMCGVVETGVPAIVETVVDREAPIGPLSGVFTHRAIPFGPDAVMNMLTDITTQRRIETELERYAQIAAHDLREPLTAIGLFVEQLARRLERGGDEVQVQRPTSCDDRCRTRGWVLALHRPGQWGGDPARARRRRLCDVPARPRRCLRGLRHRPRRVPKDRRGARRSHHRDAVARRRHHHSLQLARRRLNDAAAAVDHRRRP
jgi:hypothetical protein